MDDQARDRVLLEIASGVAGLNEKTRWLEQQLVGPNGAIPRLESALENGLREADEKVEKDIGSLRVDLLDRLKRGDEKTENEVASLKKDTIDPMSRRAELQQKMIYVLLVMVALILFGNQRTADLAKQLVKLLMP